MSGEGFHDDCIDLINAYCERNSTDFQLFCDDWKRKGFHYVFYGHAFQHDLLLYTENCFVILKNIFTSCLTFIERIAALYLMYAMYFKQPTKDFCKFRFTMGDWTKMKAFYNGVSTESKYFQARAIFWRLWQGHAFRFVESDLEHYPETMQLHRVGTNDKGDFQKINATIMNTIKDVQNESRGLLSAIETLQVGYNEMKEHFTANTDDCMNLQSIDVIKGVNTHLAKIKKIYENQMPKRKVKQKAGDEGSSKNAHQSQENGYQIELNESSSSYCESNDDLESASDNTDDNTDSCLNIGSKRYYLKRGALQKQTGGMHRLRSTVVQTQSSPKKMSSPKKHVQSEQEVRQECVQLEQEADKEQPSGASTPQPSMNQVIIKESVDSILINHPKRKYNRQPKGSASSVRKQIITCPTELSAEIDSRKRTRTKRK